MRFVVILFSVLAAIVVALFFLVVQPGTSGIIASLRLPDGSEYMVTQRCNWSTEPYTVDFYMRPGDGPWGWCYIDHQANRWYDAAMTYDPANNIVTVTKRGTWQAALDRKRNIFSIGDGKPSRELAAPQEIHQPEFSFR